MRFSYLLLLVGAVLATCDASSESKQLNGADIPSELQSLAVDQKDNTRRFLRADTKKEKDDDFLDDDSATEEERSLWWKVQFPYWKATKVKPETVSANALARAAQNKPMGNRLERAMAYASYLKKPSKKHLKELKTSS